MKDTFQTVIDDKRLLYEYIRGSHLYNLNNEDSDVDTSGIYIARKDDLMGLGASYQPQISDKKHDTTWYEIGRFASLILSSNPTVLEALFVPENKIITPPSDAIMPFIENRNEFISKQCFMPFIGYAVQQIHKARGLNKKIVNPIVERKSAFDFTYTFYKQGSTKIENWLDNRGLNKDFCGLVHIPNMHDTYGVYYDWGAHIEHYKIIYDDIELGIFGDSILTKILNFGLSNQNTLPSLIVKNGNFIKEFYNIKSKRQLLEWFDSNLRIKHYRGMCLEAATDLRCTSVSKGELPICYVVFNESGFTDHCKKYNEYKEWEKNRNPKRYESNLNKNYDSKNMMHCVRLMHMGLEIAEGRGINLERTYDKEFLMNIRNHKYEYDELMEMIQKDKEQLDEAIKNSKIKEKINIELVNDILLESRKNFYGMF